MSELEKKVAEVIVDVGKDVADDLIRPTSKAIGNHLGMFIDGAMGWLGYWGEKQKVKRAAYLELYKRSIQQKLEAIPQEHLIEPQARIAGPVIEASKYFIEEEECREMFSQLLASSCNEEMVGFVHPSFPTIIQQLSPFDASFLQIFTVHNTYAVAKFKATHSDRKATPYLHLAFDFKELSSRFQPSDELQLTQTVDNLIRLGIVYLNREVLELNYNYDSFKEHWYYKGIQDTLNNSSSISMIKYRIELTELGKNFMKCCFLSKE